MNTYLRHIVMGKSARTLISKKGREYRKAIQDECLVINPATLAGPLSCVLDLYPPCRRRRDCDNHAKALLDALTHANVYGDDSQIIDLRIRMHPKEPPGKVIVTLEPIEGLQTQHNQIDLAVG